METSGLYIAVKYNPYSVNKIIEIAENYQVPNIIASDKFHTTLIYSTKGGAIMPKLMITFNM